MTKNQLTPLDVELEQSADLLAQMPDGMIGRYGSTVGIRYLEGLLRRAAEEVRADEPKVSACSGCGCTCGACDSGAPHDPGCPGPYAEGFTRAPVKSEATTIAATFNRPEPKGHEAVCEHYERALKTIAEADTLSPRGLLQEVARESLGKGQQMRADLGSPFAQGGLILGFPDGVNWTDDK